MHQNWQLKKIFIRHSFQLTITPVLLLTCFTLVVFVPFTFCLFLAYLFWYLPPPFYIFSFDDLVLSPKFLQLFRFVVSALWATLSAIKIKFVSLLLYSTPSSSLSPVNNRNQETSACVKPADHLVWNERRNCAVSSFLKILFTLKLVFCSVNGTKCVKRFEARKRKKENMQSEAS